MKNVLVFGGNGFIGRKLVKTLARDYRVLVADVSIQDVPDVENVTYVNCDFIRQADFSTLLEGVDIVFHLICTALPEDGTDGLEQEIEANLFSTIRLLDALKSYPEKRLFFLSSGGTVYGWGGTPQKESDHTLPICKYGFLKDATEKVFELYRVMHGFSYRVIRLSNPYGTKMRRGQRQGLIPILADCIWNDREFHIWGSGENVRDYIHIDDAVQAIRAVMEYEGESRIFNVGSGTGYTVNEVVSLVEAASGREYNQLVYEPARLCDVEYNVLDISRIGKLTGWQPRISLTEGIELLIEQYRQHDTGGL